ncbi:MAG TPA: hypothetical protein VLA43_06480 [Longimicrobiales bacterium]|nr:hypothetical protein [Longimicrobiales bacterium]
MNPQRPPPELRRAQAVGELLRMTRAVIRDGEITELEAEFIRFWLDANREILGTPPLDRVAPLLRQLGEASEALDAGARATMVRLLEEAVEGGRPAGGED